MVDPKVKGATAETKVRDELRKLTGLQWERTPGSGALNEKHGLKGDLYVPNSKNYYCVEVKHYEEDHFNSTLLTSKNPQLIDWWQQAVRQGTQVSREPLLIFKHNRSKLFCGFRELPEGDYRYSYVNVPPYEFYIAKLDDYIMNNKPKFTDG